MTQYINFRNGMQAATENNLMQPVNDFLNSPGVVGANDLNVSQHSTVNSQVDITSGVCYVQNGSSTWTQNNGTITKYYQYINTSIVSLTIAANASGNPRIDLIAVKVDLSIGSDALADNMGSLIIIQGTATATPVAPNLPDTINGYYILAQVSVPNGFSTITNANVTNTRSQASFNYSSRDRKIINGNFDVWQSGTSFNSNTYTADQWQTNYDGSIGTFTVNQIAFVTGQNAVPNNPTYYMEWNQTVAGSGSTVRQIRQPIENVATYSGQTFTISASLKADTTRVVGISAQQYFGSTGSSSVATPVQNITLTNTWQQYQVTFTIPSILGKTISGTSIALYLIFSLPINTIMVIDLAQVTDNIGTVALPFVNKSISQEIMDCQRYLEKSTSLNTLVGTSGQGLSLGLGNGANDAMAFVIFKTTKRVVPVITLYSYAGTVNKITLFNGTVDVGTTMSVSQSTDRDFTRLSDPGSGLGAGNRYWFGWIADARI